MHHLKGAGFNLGPAGGVRGGWSSITGGCAGTGLLQVCVCVCVEAFSRCWWVSRAAPRNTTLRRRTGVKEELDQMRWGGSGHLLGGGCWGQGGVYWLIPCLQFCALAADPAGWAQLPRLGQNLWIPGSSGAPRLPKLSTQSNLLVSALVARVCACVCACRRGSPAVGVSCSSGVFSRFLSALEF